MAKPVQRIVGQGRRGRLTYANVVATLALIGVLTGGTAYAANTVFSADIVDGQVKAPTSARARLQTDEIVGAKVTTLVDRADDTTSSRLTRAGHQNESAGRPRRHRQRPERSGQGPRSTSRRSDRVPTALPGRHRAQCLAPECNPEAPTFLTCASVPVPRDRAQRLRVGPSEGAKRVHYLESGGCRLHINGSPIDASETTFTPGVPHASKIGLENRSLIAVADVLPPRHRLAANEWTGEHRSNSKSPSLGSASRCRPDLEDREIQRNGSVAGSRRCWRRWAC